MQRAPLVTVLGGLAIAACGTGSFREDRLVKKKKEPAPQPSHDTVVTPAAGDEQADEPVSVSGAYLVHELTGVRVLEIGVRVEDAQHRKLAAIEVVSVVLSDGITVLRPTLEPKSAGDRFAVTYILTQPVPQALRMAKVTVRDRAGTVREIASELPLEAVQPATTPHSLPSPSPSPSASTLVFEGAWARGDLGAQFYLDAADFCDPGGVLKPRISTTFADTVRTQDVAIELNTRQTYSHRDMCFRPFASAKGQGTTLVTASNGCFAVLIPDVGNPCGLTVMIARQANGPTEVEMQRIVAANRCGG